MNVQKSIHPFIFTSCVVQVLVLAESLQRIAASFDDLRSQRYRQKANEERQRKQIAYKVW
jgi:hypothetical protein